MKAVIEQVDPQILVHLESIDIAFMDFAYRWVACQLTREFNIYQIMRIYDTYFSEEEGFSQYHCYVCSALFLKFSDQLKTMDFQDCLQFL
jgi:TBC1 domain family member 2